MSSPLQSTLAAFDRSFIGVSYRRPAEKPDLINDGAVSLVINVNANATKVRTATLCVRVDDATGALQRQIPKHSLIHDNGRDVITIRTAVIVEEMKSYAYPYTFNKSEEVLPTLADVYCTGLYAWDSQEMTRLRSDTPVTLPVPSPAAERQMQGRRKQWRRCGRGR